jgi:hypothetical protein
MNKTTIKSYLDLLRVWKDDSHLVWLSDNKKKRLNVNIENYYAKVYQEIIDVFPRFDICNPEGGFLGFAGTGLALKQENGRIFCCYRSRGATDKFHNLLTFISSETALIVGLIEGNLFIADGESHRLDDCSFFIG